MKKKGFLFATLLTILLAAVMGLAAYGDENTVTYTVTFESNGGSAMEAVTVEQGGSVNLPAPTKDGYTFAGWFDNAELSGGKLSTPYTPTGNVTLYAKWSKSGSDVPVPTEKYTIEFETNGGNTIESIMVDQGSNVNLPVPTKDGFTFDGWFDNIDLNGTKLTTPYTPTGNVTLYAKWKEAGGDVQEPTEKHTIEFETNGGSIVETVTVEQGGSVNLPAPTKDGYTFAGWFDNSGFTGSKLSTPYTPNGNVTLYAKWTEIEIPKALFTITFESNGGSAVESITVTEGNSIELPLPAKDGFMFAGWFDNQDLNGDRLTMSYVPSGNVTLYAKYITDPLKYSLNNGSYAVTGITDKTVTEIFIPETYNKEPVTSIGAQTFRGCRGLTSVTIPDSVTNIGDGAFLDCTGLTSVMIGNNVTSIGAKTFYGCSGLTSVTIPNSVMSIGDSAFHGCSGLTTITIPESVTSIGGSAFYGCSGLTSVTIENNVTSIGAQTFRGCRGLTSVTIPDSVTNIGDGAFLDCTGLTSVMIGNNVTSIGAKTFYGCSGLTSVTIPNSVMSIGDSAFHSCSGLTTITIPESVTSIGDSAFSYCSGLTSITIPDSVTSIGDWAFSGCSMTSITIPKNVMSFGKAVFSDCYSLTNILVNSENKKFHSVGNCCIIETISKKLIFGLKNTVIPTDGSVTSIGDYAFYNYHFGFSNISIPNSVTSIGSYAFQYCSGLKSIEIPNSVKSIGEYTFFGCGGLTSVTIGNSVTSIGEYAFYRCTRLTSVTIGNNVTSIGNYAFSKCSGLTSITIPESVTSIGDYAFFICNKLTSLIYTGTKAEWKAISKSWSWNSNTGSYTVTCTDGKLDKDGNEITE